jgi:hypothetical protein
VGAVLSQYAHQAGDSRRGGKRKFNTRNYMTDFQFSKSLDFSESFYNLWKSDKANSDWMKLAIGTYISSTKNQSGTDFELLKTCTSIELLCWIILVKNNFLSEDGMKINLDDRIRLIMQIKSIPIEIPNSIKSKLLLETKLQIKDIPKMLLLKRGFAFDF